MRAVIRQATGTIWLFTNPRTRKPYTVNGVAHVFDRAVVRAGITTGDVTLHTLRHTALSRMIAQGIDDFTVMAISGHSDIRMLARYTHPTTARKLEALSDVGDGQNVGRLENFDAHSQGSTRQNQAELLGDFGGRREARTRDLRVANAALSQLS